MNWVIATAAVVGTLAALRTVQLTQRSIRKLAETLPKMDAQLAAMNAQHEVMEEQRQVMSAQLVAARAEREAAESVARIEALERAADALARVAEVADFQVQKHGNNDLSIGYAPNLPMERARLSATVSAVIALGGPSLDDSLRVATNSEFTALGPIASAARSAMREIETALADEAEARG